MKTKFLGFMGTALALAMTGTAVQAQTGSQPPSEIRMSPEGMEVLCKNFPMNSRCAKNPTTNSQTQPQPSEMTPAPSNDAEPSEMSPAPSNDAEPSQMSPAPSSDAEPSELTPAPSGNDAQPRM